MPRRNRVTPLSQIVADPALGLVFGNRGCLHDGEGRIRRNHAARAWIACRLTFKDRRRALMQPGRYTELFFLDDATALSAGHRPCAECRRADYRAFKGLWPGTGPESAPALDARLHSERLTDAGAQRHHRRALGELPDGVFILRDGSPWLVRGERLLRWAPGGYAEAVPRPAVGEAAVITPKSVVTVLERGWRPTAVPFLLPSAESCQTEQP
jgi:hypothetical protein